MPVRSTFTPYELDRFTIVDPLTGKRYPRVAGGDGPTDPPTLVQLVEQAEGDLSALSADELAALRTSLTDAYTAARANVTSDEEVEALGTVTAAVTRIDGEVEDRATAAAAREERLAELDAQVLTPVAEADDTGGEPGDDEGDDAGGDDGGDTNVEVTVENADTPPAEAEAEVVHTPELVTAAAAPVRRPPPNLSILNTQRRDPDPEPDGRGDGTLRLRGRIVASADTALVQRGQSFTDVERLGEVIATRASELVVQAPSQAKHYIGQVVLADRPNVVKQADHNVDDGSIIDLAVRRNTDARLASAMAALSSTDRRVAAGGVCVPAQPDYTITTVGDRGAAWVDTLPTIQGNRPISFWRWINMSLTATPGSRVGARPAAGIGTVTAAQDLAGYGDPDADPSTVPEGGHAFKDCVHIDCPTPVSEAPEAIFSCTCVGNFAAITWPEYVRVFDETVGFYFDVIRDEQALAKFVAFAKNLSSEAPAFGASRDLLDRMRRLVAHVRSVRKAPNMTFTFAVPGFARYMVAQDLADSFGETSGGWPSAGQALARLAIDEGIMIDEYNVSIGATADGSATVLPELTDGTALPDWPSEIRILAYPEGGVFRHDYGSLNFGLRETQMTTNDFCAFYETFESVAFRTTDLFTLDVPLCVNGALGATVEKLCEAS